jgi:ribonuclease-3
METDYLALEKLINVQFGDKKMLQNAFVHRSYLNEHKDFELPSNEKLEFLGDSVLSLITSIYLYKNYSDLKEGDYTDIKASIVRTESLAEAARRLQLGNYLHLSRGQEQEQGRDNTNILADTFEALLAVIFLDKGFDTAYQFIEKNLFKDKLNTIIKNKLYLSPKSRLQEYLQAKYKVTPTYIVLREEGPEHLRTFTVAAMFAEKAIGTGSGKSKKEAEEAAAENAFEKRDHF